MVATVAHPQQCVVIHVPHNVKTLNTLYILKPLMLYKQVNPGKSEYYLSNTIQGIYRRNNLPSGIVKVNYSQASTGEQAKNNSRQGVGLYQDISYKCKTNS